MDNNLTNPYAGNLLITKLPSIPNDEAILRHLTITPKIPKGILDMPTEVRLRFLHEIKHSLHIPSHECCKLFETVDLMIREGYRTRNPAEALIWGRLMGSTTIRNDTNHGTSNISASVEGPPGSGKSIGIHHILNKYTQVIEHRKFPNILGSHYQMVWLSVEIPPSGKIEDFARELMREWDDVLLKNLPNSAARFTDLLNAKNRDGGKLFDEWRQVAESHFLGFLHLDEVQNFFKIPTLKQRQSKHRGNRLELSLVEDKLLKTMLNLINSGIPVMVSGTPDGITALSNRFSTAQRISSFGYHEFLRFESPSDVEFQEFFGELMKYQYVKTPLTLTEELASLIIELTAGIKRLIINLWIFAHRAAYSRGQDNLLLEDFKTAEKQNFKKIRPAVQAILSGDPFLMSQHLDLLGGLY